MSTNQIYQAQNGLAVIEVESTPPTGGWQSQQQYSGFTGNAYYRYVGKGLTTGISGIKDSVLSYTVNLDQDGKYFLSLRSLRVQEGRNATAGQENDFWVRVNGGDWVKVRFGGPFGEWTWANLRNVTNVAGNLEVTSYDLQAGLNTIEIGGRSSNAMLDRIHLSKNKLNRDETSPPSQISAVAPPPVDPPPIDPAPVDPPPVDPPPVDPAPVDPTPPTPPVPSTLTIEAEDFATLSNYAKQTINPALTVIRLQAAVPAGNSGEASTSFTGATGLYAIQVRYLDESDGEGQISLSIGGTPIETLQLNQNTGNTTGLPVSTWAVNGGQPLLIQQGDEIKFVGVRNAEEFARIDSITFIPVGTPVDPTPVDPTPVDPTPVDPNPVDPPPIDPSPVGPLPINDQAVLSISENNLLTVGNTTATKTVKFTVLEPSKVGAVEVGFFAVDDGQGTMNSIAPDSMGYMAAALPTTKTIFSTLGDLDIQGLDFLRFASLLGGQNYGFFLTQNGTVDSVLSNGIGEVIFASPLSGQENNQPLEVSFLADQGAYVFNWDLNGDGLFDDFRFKIELFDDNGLPLGSNLQGGQESEMLDLRSLSGQVNLDLSVFREADNDNILGFYQVENTQGTLLDEFGNVLNPGDSGYVQAAVRQWFDKPVISPTNQSVLSTSVTVDAGKILVPFLITQGTVGDILASEFTDASVFFPFLKANPGGVDHVKLLGSNTFGFEDIVGGGDLDYDDLIVKINVQPI
ncbi:DUF4114 domain-containing protein [Nodosilinea sp. LEGE 07088]|uniref:DUF4114 domain-containing protein n=1 Tax=Nodosilinea sp. LEGE 07088 TaxID=2777968 RepID=UPI0018804834|nr:DUF4114 domain-containing protein [Nodosilinea sp. LEGE 07088]MBE9136323.1 DUF4114 domain-containing protein [Nodosilinea sp. LEGE 07088]